MIWIALLLGLVQGVTEFLPVSSSGHLALAKMLFPGFETPGLLFEILLHIATAIAVIIFLRREILEVIKPLFVSGDIDNRNEKFRFIGIVILATVPTAVIGLLLKDTVTSAFSSKLMIMSAYIVTGGLLLLTLKKCAKSTGLYEITFSQALIIGTIQGLAVFPGISRSGATIAVALLLGLAPAAAARFSFFIFLPAIAGAILLDVKTLLDTFSNYSSAIMPMLAGMVVAGITGYLCLKLLFNLTDRMKLYLFAPYCFLLALLLVVI